MAGKASMGRTCERPGGSNRKTPQNEVPVDKALPGTSQAKTYSAEKAEPVQTIAEQVQKRVDAMRPQREQLKRSVEVCLCHALADNSLEVVGSTAWGGEVPQSDLDLVLVTPSADSSPPQALELLQSLAKQLESQAESAWARLELVEARKVPVLRLYDRRGLSCDVVVDQMHALDHRKLLIDALEGRPEVKSFVRLVKYWLRQRGLPVGSEGGLPSFAWAFSALQLALQLPRESTVEELLFHFFKRMNLLSSMSLLVQKDGRIAWKARKGSSPWSQEWIEFIWVEDPTQKPSGAGYVQGMTPHSIPTALGALYLAEIRLAQRAIQEGKWGDLWRPINAELKLPLAVPMKAKVLHVALKNGELIVGKLEKVLQCPNVQKQELHRRDQSSDLELLCCSLLKDSQSESTRCAMTEETVCCKPCNWICALPTWNMTVKAGDAQTRLSELSAIVENWKEKRPAATARVQHKTGQMKMQNVPSQAMPVLAPMVLGYPVGVYMMPVSASRMEQMKDLCKVWPSPRPLAVGLQAHTSIRDPKVQGAMPSEKSAGSDDSTRASDSEEFMPVRKKGKKVPKKKKAEAEKSLSSPTFSNSEVYNPFATALALNLDMPRGGMEKPKLAVRVSLQGDS